MAESVGELAYTPGFLKRLPRRVWRGPNPSQLGLFALEGVAPVAGSLPSLAVALAAVPEHRRPFGYQPEHPPYPLVPMLFLLLIGVLVRREGYTAIAEWAASCAREAPEVLDRLGFAAERRRRTPAAATLFRLARDLDLAALGQALQGWFASLSAVLGRELPQPGAPTDQVALDGKTIRGASARRGESPEDFVHLVSAYQPALALVLDQAACAGKGQELAAVELLLGRLPLAGRVVTGDALLTQRGVCQTITEGGGDYLFPVKENQPALRADVEAAFSPPGVGGRGAADPARSGRRTGSAADGAPRRAADHRSDPQR